MNKFIETIFFHRNKEANLKIMQKAEENDFRNLSDVLYLGYEIKMDVEISEGGKFKVLNIQGVDIADKEIYI